MSFASPAWLLVLLAVAVLPLAQWLLRRRRRRYAVRFPATDSLLLAAAAADVWRRRIPPLLLLAAAAVLALALARPRVPHQVAVQEASLMLVTDHSGSMAADDVQPTRLAAAVRAAETFIAGLPTGVRVGAVAFGSSPDAVQGPSADHSAARAVIDSQSAVGATDTGDAVALALQLLHASDPHHSPAAVVLLSDGSANAGVNVLTVARQAAQDRVPIYTVALGTPDGVINPNPGLSPPVAVPPDPQLMQQIARLSGGRTFSAQSADQLSSIYGDLARRLSTRSEPRDVTVALVIAGGLLLLLALGAGVRVAAPLP